MVELFSDEESAVEAAVGEAAEQNIAPAVVASAVVERG